MKPGANLFKDFQALGRIWTHPWCLQLKEQKNKEKKVQRIITFLHHLLVFYLF